MTHPDQVIIEELVIYNRWGSEVWRYNASLETSWDGKINNETAAQDVYVVKIRLHSLNGRLDAKPSGLKIKKGKTQFNR